MQQPKSQELFNGFFRLMLIGPSNSGKTMTLYQLLTNPRFGLDTRFKCDQIYLVSPNLTTDEQQRKLLKLLNAKEGNDGAKFDEETQVLKDLPLTAKFIENLYKNQKDAKELFIEQTEEGVKPIPFYEKLLILDDVIGNKKKFNIQKSGILDEIIIQARHAELNIIILSQYYKSVSQIIRTNCTHLIFYNNPINSEIIKFKDEVSANLKKSVFDEIYDDAMDKEYSALLILQFKPTKQKFFRIYDYDQIYQYSL